MVEPVAPDAARLTAELSDLVAQIGGGLPGDGERLLAIADRCDVILGLLQALSAAEAQAETLAAAPAGADRA